MEKARLYYFKRGPSFAASASHVLIENLTQSAQSSLNSERNRGLEHYILYVTTSLNADFMSEMHTYVVLPTSVQRALHETVIQNSPVY
jgi:hypothetical protein